MKTIIVYMSSHHGNTKKLAEAIAEGKEIKLVNILEHPEFDLSDYDRIGIASGIAFGKYYPQMLEFVAKNMPENKQVFFIHTAGDPRESHNAAVKMITDGRSCTCLGTYFCKGFDTYGPFKLIGGIAKGHPNCNDIQKAKAFYDSLKTDANNQKCNIQRG